MKIRSGKTKRGAQEDCTVEGVLTFRKSGDVELEVGCYRGGFLWVTFEIHDNPGMVDALISHLTELRDRRERQRDLAEDEDDEEDNT